MVGVNVWKIPVTLYGNHVKLGAPMPIIDTAVPEQIIATVGGNIDIGKDAALVIDVVNVPVQPAVEVPIVV